MNDTTKSIMSKCKIFFDSSALIAGAISAKGAARALLQLAEAGKIELVINEQVILETERGLARKSPRNLPDFRMLIKVARPLIVKEFPEDVIRCIYMISDPTDAPILAAAIKARVDFLVTHNRRHFLDDPKVAEKSGLQIGTPGDALAWFKEKL
ncbi:MAG: PIN domain-containing protein [Chloroflexota bacterium]